MTAGCQVSDFREPDGEAADDRVRLVVAPVAVIVGAVGVALYPRSHYLWLPSVVLLIVSISLIVWVLLRVVRRHR